MPKILIALFLAAFAIPLVAHERLVMVEGSGEIEVLPDLVRIGITVSKQDKLDIAKAKAHVDELSSNAAAALTALGVREEDIISSSMGIRIAYRYDNNDNAVAAGHIASRDIDITVRDIDRYADVVQALVDIGISEIESVDSDVSDYRALRKRALGLALKDARQRAGFMARELGFSLGRVHQVRKQKTFWNIGELEEVIVSGGRRDDNVKTLQYEFQPSPVEVWATVYVEYTIE